MLKSISTSVSADNEVWTISPASDTCVMVLPSNLQITLFNTGFVFSSSAVRENLTFVPSFMQFTFPVVVASYMVT